MNTEEKEYIGDGIYVEFNSSCGIILTTENDYIPRNKIYLGQRAFEKLKKYEERKRNK